MTTPKDTPQTRPRSEDGDCLHPGEHCEPLRCPDCGRFSGHSWSTGWYGTQNGQNQHWGAECSKCGEWSESAS